MIKTARILRECWKADLDNHTQLDNWCKSLIKKDLSLVCASGRCDLNLCNHIQGDRFTVLSKKFEFTREGELASQDMDEFLSG